MAMVGWLLLALAARGARAFVGDYRDHNGNPTDAALASLVAACDGAIADELARAAAGAPPFEALADAVAGAPSSKDERGLSLAYLVMAGRSFAQYTVTRLVRATYSPHNLYLVHADAKLDDGTLQPLRSTLAPHANIHFLARRHAVGWGAFSMVAVLLDAVATAVASGGAYDFLINLSDSDVALRTHDEISAFLAPFRGTSFVAVKEPSRDELRYRSHAHMRRLTFVECAGRGFAVLNASAEALFGAGVRHCCLARSGPILYTAAAHFDAPRMPDGVEVFHGSQWAILARPFVEHLALAAARLRPPRNARPDAQPAEAAEAVGEGAAPVDAYEVSEAESAELAAAASRARALIGGFRFSYMADEAFAQTALLASPFRARAVSHNLRYIDWPSGQAGMQYWARMGNAYASGPRVLGIGDLGTLRTSEAMFARKVDPAIDAELISAWDSVMERKLRGEHPSDQPPIGRSLLDRDPTLVREWAPPRTRAERTAGAADAEAHALHYGHEDMLADFYAPQDAATPSGAPPRAGGGGGSGGTPRPPRLSHVTFADGSVCHCDGTCTRDGGVCCAERIAGCTSGGVGRI